MAKRKRKVRKMRGSKTHGRGAKSKGRGAGSRGGRGKAGSLKHHVKKFPPLLKKGFSIPRKARKEINAINIKDLPKKDEIDLLELGYDKLLGKGQVKRPIKVKAKYFSRKAKEKIQSAGGKAIEK